MFSTHPEFYTFSGALRTTGTKLYFFGDVTLRLSSAVGPINSDHVTEDGDRVLFEANETTVSRVAPWDVPDTDMDVVQEGATITVAHVGDDAYLIGEYGAFPYGSYYIVYNDQIYEVGDAMRSESFEDEFLGFDVSEDVARVKNVSSGLAKPMETETLTDLNNRGEIRAAMRIHD